MMHPENWLQRLEKSAAQGLRRRLPDPSGPGPDLIDCGSNDYLGLSRHPQVLAAAHEALERYGAGATASRLVRGNREVHVELEAELARLKGTDAALVFASGYSANLGLLSALCGPDDTILCDRLDHASLVDGGRLSRAKLRFYAHRDPGHLERQIARVRGPGEIFVVTDGVFSMDGTLAPIPELLEVTERHGAMLIVDDAHATGCVGPGGAGTAAHYGIEPGRLIHVGTLSKALGAQGGFVAGSVALVDMLVQFSRAFIYSTGLGPAAAAAATAALRVSRDEPQWRDRLQANLGHLMSRLDAAGYRSYGDPPAPMRALHVGEPGRSLEVSSSMAAAGVLAPAIRPPTVPGGTSRIRLAPTALLTTTDVDRVVSAIRAAFDPARE